MQTKKPMRRRKLTAQFLDGKYIPINWKKSKEQYVFEKKRIFCEKSDKL